MATHGLAFTSFAELLTVCPEAHRIIAAARAKSLTRADLRSQIAGLYNYLSDLPPGPAQLHCNDSYSFLVGLGALLVADRKILLSPLASGTSTLRGHDSPVVCISDAAVSAESNDRVAPQPTFFIHPLAFQPADIELPEINSFLPRIIFQTSGSTGEPKQIPKSISQLECEIRTLEKMWGEEINTATVFATVSHQHIYGLLFKVLWPLFSGRTFRSESVFYPEELLFELQATDDGILISSPAYLKRLPDHVALESLPPSLKLIFSSGGKLENEVARRYWSISGKRVIEVFGSTETGGIAWREQRGADEELPWAPFSEISVRVGNNSALEILSPYVDPGDTREWFSTADAIEAVPGTNRFFLLGRLDRVVKIEEKRISLGELEEELARHAFVKQSSVVSVQAGGRATLGVAVVLTEHGRSVLDGKGRKDVRLELQRSLKAHFDPVVVPRIWRFVDSLPVNEQGKVVVTEVHNIFRTERPTLPEIISRERAEDRITVRARVPKDLDYFDGHFEEFAVVPGVVQLEWVARFLKEFISALPGRPGLPALSVMENVKFHDVLLPEAECSIEIIWEADKSRARYLICDGDKKYSSGRMVFV